MAQTRCVANTRIITCRHKQYAVVAKYASGGRHRGSTTGGCKQCLPIHPRCKEYAILARRVWKHSYPNLARWQFSTSERCCRHRAWRTNLLYHSPTAWQARSLDRYISIAGKQRTGSGRTLQSQDGRAVQIFPCQCGLEHNIGHNNVCKRIGKRSV